MSTPAPSLAVTGPREQITFLEPHTIGKTARVFVDPPIFHIGNGDSPKTIHFVNQTGGPVKIWLPNADKYLNPPPGGGDYSVPIEVRGRDLDLTVKTKPDGPKEGHYHYHVYCEQIANFAEGNSPPVMHCP